MSWEINFLIISYGVRWTNPELDNNKYLVESSFDVILIGEELSYSIISKGNSIFCSFSLSLFSLFNLVYFS